jgi:hypothetical protein
MNTEILVQTDGYNVSNRYNVIPSIEVMQEFERFGFQLDSVEAAGVRSVERALKQKHMIRMSAEEKMFGGELKPQVIIYNSYDGTAALNIHVGIFRFVCSNGLIAGHNLIQPMRTVHHNSQWKDLVHEYIDTYSEKYTAQKEQILHMKEKRMSLDEAYVLAEQALQFRHIDQRIPNEAVDPLELLIAKRREDRGDSAWLRFNVLQESIINGLYRKYNNDGSIHKAKILTSIDEIIRVNVQLSDLFGEAI